MELSQSAAESGQFGKKVVLLAGGIEAGILRRMVDGEGVRYLGRIGEQDKHDALAGALNRLLRDPDLRTRLGEAARERVRREFSLARMVNDTLAVYREAVTDVSRTPSR